MLEFVFHGTGTSSSLPHIKCLTDPNTKCRSCPSTLTPEGKKNIRRNTGAIIRKRVKSTNATNGTSGTEERDVVVVIDVGKTFLASALEWFPKYGFRKIDAILLTHAHADAINGLDDLRSWTLRGSIQTHIDIYASLTCFTEIKRAFPYLVSKDFATGGGDVPEFRWHIIKEHETFAIEGGAFWITPVAVDHGRQFPTSTVQQAGPNGLLTPQPERSPVASGNCTPSNDPICSPVTAQNKASAHIPFKCFGFIINSTIFYLSDVSHVPEDEWKTILHPPPKPLIDSTDSDEPNQPTTPNSEKMPAPPSASYSMMVVDVLKPKPHISHFGIDQAVQTARRAGAQRNYMVGFTHELNHDDWVAVGEVLGQEDWSTKTKDQPQHIKHAVELVKEGPPVWLRPAFDGLRVYVPEPDDVDQTIIDGFS